MSEQRCWIARNETDPNWIHIHSTMPVWVPLFHGDETTYRKTHGGYDRYLGAFVQSDYGGCSFHVPLAMLSVFGLKSIEIGEVFEVFLTAIAAKAVPRIDRSNWSTV